MMTTSEAMWCWEIPLPQTLDTDAIIAILDTLGCSGFEEHENALLAYAPTTAGIQESVNAWLDGMHIVARQTVITPQNWNAVWESNFSPMIIDGFVGVRAHFHEPTPAVAHDLIITPKMSFGTGHHATTQLMVMQMKPLAFKDKRVLDFGTGTGVLAILAKKMGAAEVVAIDHDDWSMTNAAENAAINGVELVLTKADHPNGYGLFDVVLANINLHILLEHAAALKNCLAASGMLLISGILPTDAPAVSAAFAAVGLKMESSHELNGWMVCRLLKAHF